MRELDYGRMSLRELDYAIAEGLGYSNLEWVPIPFSDDPTLVYQDKDFPCPVPEFSKSSSTAFLLLEKIREELNSLSLIWQRGDNWEVEVSPEESVILSASHPCYATAVGILACKFFAYKKQL